MEAHEIAHQAQYASTNGNGQRRSRSSVNDGPPIPGMWGFVTSGYFVGLFVVAFVLNRIQNTVVPPHRPPGFRIHRNYYALHRRPLSWHQLVFSRFFPVDFSATFSRTLFRIPSLYLLGRAFVLWMLLLLQSQQVSIVAEASWLQPLGVWAAEKKVEDVCWYTFLAACATLCIGTLTTGLEGINMNEVSPFNLFAFAFQLYMCSAAHSYSQKDTQTPPKPDVHVIITIMLPLIQLTVMHCLEIKHRWTQYRLAISTAIGIAALLHFHLVVWVSPSAYPITTFAARMVETGMLAVIGFSVGLNALTQLLLSGAIARPLFGHSAILPRPDEDFNVALFRLGTASMDATAVAGLGNEVGGVTNAQLESAAVGAPRPDVVRGELELDRTGIAALSSSYEQHGTRRVLRKGFANEIANVKAKGAKTDVWMNTVLNAAWQRHLGEFLVSVWRAAGRVLTLCVGWMRGNRGAGGEEPPIASSDVDVSSTSRPAARATQDPYDRFLRGEPVSDDDEDFEPDERRRHRSRTPAMPSSASESEGEDEHASGEAPEDVDGDDEQAMLYADLSTSASQVASAPLLLAHMTDKSASPLTRRGYRRLVSGARRTDGDEREEWDEFVLERRHAKRTAAEARGEDAFAEQTRNCVICTVEPRDIICWPCRCLALCDDCRENLAARSSASKHTCPCCRRSVEGYSKIYIP
ncbi:hypothetical protein BC628DRAFT_1330955 [Trametes gibbosa]|uniref:RING-type domain-containing protein n=1 Tax=Trametes gibbosa TaxID=160864 RepID=A0A6G6FQ75_9APHY|nr:hypothetical protein BC628DRAFT_1330955 [Trametes gibbosa]QIE48420.1 hypothetical protein [Trametes gibbosa]